MRASVLPGSARPPVPQSMTCPSDSEMNIQDEMGNLNTNPRSNVHPVRSTYPPPSSGFQTGSQGHSPDLSGRGIRPPKPPAPTLEKDLLSSTGEGQGSTPWATASDSGQDAYQHEHMLGTGAEPEAKRHDSEPPRPCGLSEPPLAQRDSARRPVKGRRHPC